MRNTKFLVLHIAAALVAVLAVATIPGFASSSKYAGTYSSEAPEPKDGSTAPPSPAFSVSLGKDGTATVTQDPGKGAVTIFGHWSDSGSQITVKFDADGDQPVEPPMVLQPSHDGLHAVTWNHTLWGKITPPALKKEDSNWHTNKKHGLL
jgi:hypothetical protein